MQEPYPSSAISVHFYRVYYLFCCEMKLKGLSQEERCQPYLSISKCHNFAMKVKEWSCYVALELRIPFEVLSSTSILRNCMMILCCVAMLPNWLWQPYRLYPQEVTLYKSRSEICHLHIANLFSLFHLLVEIYDKISYQSLCICLWYCSKVTSFTHKS